MNMQSYDYNQNVGYGWQGQGNGQGQGTPYGGGRFIEAAPPLVHTQSMPALPTEAKTPRKKGIFR